MKYTITVDLLPDTVAILANSRGSTVKNRVEAALTKFAMEFVKRKAINEEKFGKLTPKGKLTTVYYYQKEKYPYLDDIEGVSEKKFVKRWLKDKKFKKIWANYEKSGFDERYAPYFIRSKITMDLIVTIKEKRKGVAFTY